jgi:DNA (cytosine-5)-methyltransferase 1
MTKFNYVSLFSGIGGFEQGLNKLGGKCLMASEVDKFAEKAYQTIYGESTVGDITKVDAAIVPDHDVLVGGFPCQSFSIAGKRGGFADARGTLFFEAARIALEKQPKVIWLENVKGLTSHDKGRTLDTIFKTLNEIGYTVDFEIRNSKYFGVPQNRERIFIVAVRDDLVEHEDWNLQGKGIMAKAKKRIAAYPDVKTFNFDWPEQKEVTVKLRDILESDVDEKYYLSEDKTANLISQLEGKGLAVKEATTKGYAVAEEGDAVNFQFPNSKTRRGRVGKQIAQTLEAGSINQGVVVTDPIMVGHADIKGHDAIKRVYSVEGIAPTLTTMGGGHREPKIAEEIRPVLTPDRPNKRQNGRRFKEDGEEAFTLTSIDRHGVAIGKYPRYRIRKLTPLECFRLQGFSDSVHQQLVDVGISDSQRYKMAGNAVTVNVIEAIGEKLIKYLDGDK